MRKKLTILTLLLTLTLSAFAQTGQQIRVYYKSGLVELISIRDGGSISHSRADLSGKVHDDYVTMDVPTDNGTRQFLFEDLDSMILPNGRCVVFNGGTKGQAEYSKESVCDVWPVGTPPSFANDGRKRSSFEGRFPGQGTGNVTFKWTENDRIRLDVGYQSRAENLSSDGTNASFFFDGADDLEGEAYTVYFPDRTVTIPAVQTQNGADNSTHIYESGDCGVATATRNSDGSYGFTLTHKAAYLCFLPHINYLPSARIDKIELTCSDAIAGTYDLSSAGLYNGTSTVNTITLNLNPQRDRDFFIGHNINTEQDSCAAYMVIAPQDGSRSFTAVYYITDTLSHISKIYRQTFSFQPLANTVYPITCNIRDTEFRTVDLGLSCNWSNVNIDATEPSRKGSTFSSDSDANAALLSETVVTEWLMPTDDQETELIEKCHWTWGEYNGQTGYLVTGAAIAKEYGTTLRIFIPCDSQVSPSECLSLNYRPVEALMVDMGLPSGVKWASRNIGANSVEDYGYYFSWGEVDTKTSYTSDTYKYGTQNLGDNYDISGTQNDAAVVNWGGIWRMPTSTDMSELMNDSYCQWTWSSINGVNGYIVTGSNGNKIFLPAAGIMKGSGLSSASRWGSYSTSTQSGDREPYSYTLDWNIDRDSGTRYLRSDNTWHPFNDWGDAANRCYGRSVRPVATPNAVTPDGNSFNIITDSATWELGNIEAMLYGTLSSSMPIKGSVKVGFVVGDSSSITKGNARFEYEKIVNVGGSFSQSQPVHDNIGYWYRAFVDTGDAVFYGKARHYGFEMVDLGIGTLWANMNVGASAPEEYGNYYAWGETTTKNDYSSGTYLYGTQNLGDGYDIAGTEHDVAHVKMGNAWRMPTSSEMDDLLSKCTWTWTSQNNVSGYMVTGTNGNSIFLPAAGYMKNSALQSKSLWGSYSTSTQSGDRDSHAYALDWNINRDSGTIYLRSDNTWHPFNDWGDAANRCYGRSVRPVAAPNAISSDSMQVMTILTDSATWKINETSATIYGTLRSTTPLLEGVKAGFVVGNSLTIEKHNATVYELIPDSKGIFHTTINVTDNIGYWYRAFVELPNGELFYGKARHFGWEMVDLGLPSGTLWCNVNVGCSWPEEYGNYYAWGETTTKSDYSFSTYLYGTQNLGINYNIGGTEYDAAYVNMNTSWRMPTSTEMDELKNNCTWRWTSQNDVNGYLVTGDNGNSIFLPAAGYMKNSSLLNLSLWGSYATSTQSGDGDSHAYILDWNIDRDSGTIYLRSDNTWHPFNDWGEAANRCYGRSVRAVANR